MSRERYELMKLVFRNMRIMKRIRKENCDIMRFPFFISAELLNRREGRDTEVYHNLFFSNSEEKESDE